MTPDSSLDVVLVYPDLLGTYGDRGNAEALAYRARARGIDCRMVVCTMHEPLPRAGDIYLLGGGEDAAMLLAWERLRATGRLQSSLDEGAVCFGVCAGFQLLSREFVGPDGVRRDGLGLLDVTCGRIDGPRAVGEVLADSTAGFLTGFENHQGDARVGPAARPLGRLVRGVGNGDGLSEGAVQGSVFGSYLHGPALVRNDWFADHLLEKVVGALPEFVDEPVRLLRRERRASALHRSSSHRWARRPHAAVSADSPAARGR